MNRWLLLATRMSRYSTHPQHKMAAVIVRGGAILSMATNLATWGHHAEIRALRPHADLLDADIYIARHNKRCSRPCQMCLNAAKRAGIRHAIYVDRAGQITKERL